MLSYDNITGNLVADIAKEQNPLKIASLWKSYNVVTHVIAWLINTVDGAAKNTEEMSIRKLLRQF